MICALSSVTTNTATNNAMDSLWNISTFSLFRIYGNVFAFKMDWNEIIRLRCELTVAFYNPYKSKESFCKLQAWQDFRDLKRGSFAAVHPSFFGRKVVIVMFCISTLSHQPPTWGQHSIIIIILWGYVWGFPNDKEYKKIKLYWA